MFATVFHECGLSKTSGTPGVVLFWKLSSVNMSAARASFWSEVGWGREAESRGVAQGPSSEKRP